MSDAPVDYLAKRDADPIHVRHSELERAGKSAFRSRCPVCKVGLLLVYRQDAAPFRLRSADRCIRCAQRFIYVDAVIAGELVVRDAFEVPS